MDGLLRKCNLNEVPYNTPALVTTGSLLKAYLSFEKMLVLISQSPKDPLSPKLLRDILISSCLIGTEASELSEVLEEEQYAGIREHVQRLVKEKVIEKTCMLRHLLSGTKVNCFKAGKLPLQETFTAATKGKCR